MWTGLDVHHNLVAATTDNGRVQIFDVRKRGELASNIKYLDRNPACVKFVDDEASRHGLKLIVAAGDRIESWAFENSDPILPYDIDDDCEVLLRERKWRVAVGDGTTWKQF